MAEADQQRARSAERPRLSWTKLRSAFFFGFSRSWMSGIESADASQIERELQAPSNSLQLASLRRGTPSSFLVRSS